VDRYWRERELTSVDDLRRITDEEGISMAQMAVGWVLANSVITSTIVGASKPEQLKDSAAALARPLAPALKQRLDSLTETYRYSHALRFSTTTPKGVKPHRWIYNKAQRAGRIQSAERAVPTRQKRKSDTNLLSA
jgi:diketogulonate reductase-like aldo/keto reductase